MAAIHSNGVQNFRTTCTTVTLGEQLTERSPIASTKRVPVHLPLISRNKETQMTALRFQEQRKGRRQHIEMFLCPSLIKFLSWEGGENLLLPLLQDLKVIIGRWGGKACLEKNRFGSAFWHTWNNCLCNGQEDEEQDRKQSGILNRYLLPYKSYPHPRNLAKSLIN